MATERDREKEAELESSMYTNCLLLGLDPAILGGTTGNGATRVGHFRHSNPRMGEQLLYFLLSALRGPVQSAKDFDKVWPIFDSAQSRDFRKIVQGIISELESQGALPRSNSRVSSLATCCGPRFVELLWQLSVHALREVHRRSFVDDVASNPLPASLTDVSYLHAAALLPVSKFLKNANVAVHRQSLHSNLAHEITSEFRVLCAEEARIALERRKFLKNANVAVHRQSLHSNLAHEITSEFRVLCAEEAYLQQELEKLQDLRNKAKLEAELWDDRVNSSSGQTAHMVSKATRHWESLLARKSQHEVLASGPIEDLIAHREHRYRISGSSLLAAMESSSRVSQTDVPLADQTSLEGRVDDRSGKVSPTVDVAEVLRRWTHALQRIHKQSLYLAKANDGEGPELLRGASDAGTSGHAESLNATLVEHRQHLVSIEGLINQLKEAVPAMQKSISDLTDEVNSLTSSMPAIGYNRSASPIQAQSSGRTFEHDADEISELTSKLSSVQLDKASTSPAMKLPHLFNLTPNLSGKGAHTSKKTAPCPNQSGSFSKKKSINLPLLTDHADNGHDHEVRNLRRSVREAALAVQSSNEIPLKDSPENKSNDDSQHFFMPLSVGTISEKDVDKAHNQHEVLTPSDTEGLKHYKGMNGHLLPMGSETLGQKTSFCFDEALDQALSPALLMDSSFFTDAYEDLLAPLSEIDAALMEQ